MTGQEVAFLLLGVLIGSGVGAAIVTVLRDRTEARPDVRVTVAPNAIPRRSGATLAYAAAAGPSLPARGGPADPWPDVPADAPPPARTRTPVRSVFRPPFVLATATAGAGSAGRLVPVPQPSPEPSGATAAQRLRASPP